MNTERPRFPYQHAMDVALEVLSALERHCERIQIAGSLRRKKPEVGDVEIVYVPLWKSAPDPNALFGNVEINRVDDAIETLERRSILVRRLNVNGRESYGEKNKLMRHVASGIPIDLFATTMDSWFNYLVCRTGPSDMNVRICNAAIARGWKWNPYGSGFSRGSERFAVKSEEDVFRFVGLPYLQPEERQQ